MVCLVVKKQTYEFDFNAKRFLKFFSCRGFGRVSNFTINLRTSRSNNVKLPCEKIIIPPKYGSDQNTLG